MDWPFTLAELPEAWQVAWSQTWHLLVAFGLALPIGWDRERRDRSAGMRTFPLVATAACGILLVGESIAGDDSEARMRAVYGVVTGIGFLGAGAILKEGRRVTGVTTAASLWNTAAVGLAVAADQFAVAVVLTGMNFALLQLKPDHDLDPPAAARD